MRQVSREDYEVLTKYHTGEIRYYVELNSATRKKVGIKVKVTPRQVKAVVPKLNVLGLKNQRGGRPRNSPIRMIRTSFVFTKGTLQDHLYYYLIGIYKRDPTMTMGRSDLVELLMKRSNRAANQAGPFISDCIFKHGILKYQGE